ncbi:predicted protein [Methanosarcina acetivorans C2A]|uniref:Uncharacterized protein n=1 Tax=Methanosarcina acetivorans (strain ATCC 35395 / DSM 2834 / JCM 12185 / C2A) TaxID=188937 RepID=Q8THX0_METAC|nr:predicted protein [Methanosarcina acetivorans C2A]
MLIACLIHHKGRNITPFLPGVSSRWGYLSYASGFTFFPLNPKWQKGLKRAFLLIFFFEFFPLILFLRGDSGFEYQVVFPASRQ